MYEFIDHYWSYYNAGVTIFLFAGISLVVRLVFFKRKRRKKEPHLTFKHWNMRFENDFESLKREIRAASFLPKEANKFLKKARKKEEKDKKLKDKENSLKKITDIREQLKSGIRTAKKIRNEPAFFKPGSLCAATIPISSRKKHSAP